MLLGPGLSQANQLSRIQAGATVGTGLVFAGVTGFCGMAQLLALMP